MSHENNFAFSSSEIPPNGIPCVLFAPISPTGKASPSSSKSAGINIGSNPNPSPITGLCAILPGQIPSETIV